MAATSVTPLNPKLQAIYDELDKLGVKISNLTQGGQNVCKGACIVWIRRAVLAKKLSYDYDKDKAPAKAQKRLEKMAATHQIVDKEARSVSTLMAQTAKTEKEYDSKISWKQSLVGPMLFWIDPADELEQKKKSATSAAYAVADDVLLYGMIQHAWPKVVMNWNQIMKSSKIPNGVKAKNLSDLTVWGIPTVAFTDIDDCLAKIFSLKNFTDSSCIMIEAIFTSKGHAIAVHRIGAENGKNILDESTFLAYACLC